MPGGPTKVKARKSILFTEGTLELITSSVRLAVCLCYLCDKQIVSQFLSDWKRLLLKWQQAVWEQWKVTVFACDN